MKITEVVAALLWEGERFLLCQRPEQKARALLWEFAGGKVEPGETREQALVRECREELGITVSVGAEFLQLVHAYPELTVRLTVFHASIAEGIPQRLEHRELRWVTPVEAGDLPLCPADRPILEKIQKEYGCG